MATHVPSVDEYLPLWGFNSSTNSIYPIQYRVEGTVYEKELNIDTDNGCIETSLVIFWPNTLTKQLRGQHHVNVRVPMFDDDNGPYLLKCAALRQYALYDETIISLIINCTMLYFMKNDKYDKRSFEEFMQSHNV